MVSDAAEIQKPKLVSSVKSSMKYVGVCLFWICLLSGSVFSEDSGRGEWVGLWHLIQETDKGPVDFHLFVPAKAEDPAFYSSSWEKLSLADWQLDPEKLVLNWQVKGFNIVFNGERSRQQVTGSWQLIHPQYRLEKRFTGKRVLSSPEWDPLTGLKRLDVTAGLMDFNAYLRNQGFKNSGEFMASWKQTLYPDFYVFLQYAPGPEKLAHLIRQADFAKRSERFSKAVTQFLKDFKRVFPQLSRPAQIVCLPFGGSEPRILWVQKKRFLLVNALQLAGQDENVRYQYRLAEKLLAAHFERGLSGANDLAWRLFRQGVPLYLVSQLGYAGSLADLLLVPQERIEGLGNQLGDLKRQARQKKEVTPEAQKYLSFQFLETLGKRFSVRKILTLKGPRVRKEFEAYTSGGGS